MTTLDEAAARNIVSALQAEFHAVHENFRNHVRGLDHGTINWKPLPKANSIAVLVVHALGSEREVILSVRQAQTQRDRDSEFRAEAEAADLLALLDQADRDVDEHLGPATAADLTERRPRGQRKPRPGLEWLITNYGHTREHLAQVELTKQLYDSRT